MTLHFLIQCDDGGSRRLPVDLERYGMFPIHTPSDPDPYEHIVYYRLDEDRINDSLWIEGGLWIKRSLEDDGDGDRASYCRPVHPMQAAFDFLRYRRLLPEKLEPYREIASNQKRYLVWCKQNQRQRLIIARRGPQPSKSGGAKKTRLAAFPNEDPPRITINNCSYMCNSQAAVAYFAKLIEAEGNRVSFPEFLTNNSGKYEGAIITRELKKLHLDVLKYIDRGKGRPARIKVEDL